MVLESSWPNIGTDIIVELVTPPLRWTQKPSRRTNKLWKKRKPLNKPKEKPEKKKLPIKPQPVKVKRTLKKLPKRNDFVCKTYYYHLILFSIHFILFDISFINFYNYKICLKLYFWKKCVNLNHKIPHSKKKFEIKHVNIFCSISNEKLY